MSSKIIYTGNEGYYKGNAFESFGQSFQWKVRLIHIKWLRPNFIFRLNAGSNQNAN